MSMVSSPIDSAQKIPKKNSDLTNESDAPNSRIKSPSNSKYEKFEINKF